MFDFEKFLVSTKRIFTVSKKPDLQEYKVMAQVTGIGIIIIGLLGFALKLISSFIPFIS